MRYLVAVRNGFVKKIFFERKIYLFTRSSWGISEANKSEKVYKTPFIYD